VKTIAGEVGGPRGRGGFESRRDVGGAGSFEWGFGVGEAWDRTVGSTQQILTAMLMPIINTLPDLSKTTFMAAIYFKCLI
jgi:hypothetical protein